MQTKQDLFAELYSESQQRLYGYVMGLVRNNEDAQDILQQTAAAAWRKFDDFDPDTSFIRWAVAIARFEAANFVKSRRRSRLYFDHELMEQLGEVVADGPSDLAEAQSAALSDCLKKLPHADTRLIECRYRHGLGSVKVAELLNRSQASVCNSLRRIRERLLSCIEKSLSRENLS